MKHLVTLEEGPMKHYFDFMLPKSSENVGRVIGNVCLAKDSFDYVPDDVSDPGGMQKEVHQGPTP